MQGIYIIQLVKKASSHVNLFKPKLKNEFWYLVVRYLVTKTSLHLAECLRLVDCHIPHVYSTKQCIFLKTKSLFPKFVSYSLLKRPNGEWNWQGSITPKWIKNNHCILNFWWLQYLNIIILCGTVIMINMNRALLPYVHENLYICSLSKHKLQNGMKVTAIWPPDGRRYDASTMVVNGVLVCYKDDDIARWVKEWRVQDFQNRGEIQLLLWIERQINAWYRRNV